MKSIDDVVENTIEEYHIDSSHESRKIYLSFLHNELDFHEWKGRFMQTKKNSRFSYLSARLFLFAVLAKLAPVKETYMGEARILRDMKTLRGRGNHPACWEDEYLYKAFETLFYCCHDKSLRRYHFSDYTETINEFGVHPMVVSAWGRSVHYDSTCTRVSAIKSYVDVPTSRMTPTCRFDRRVRCHFLV